MQSTFSVSLFFFILGSLENLGKWRIDGEKPQDRLILVKERWIIDI